MSEVVPIFKKYESISSMIAAMSVNGKSQRGFAICFDEEGTMSVGHVESTRSDICMAAIYLMNFASKMMDEP